MFTVKMTHHFFKFFIFLALSSSAQQIVVADEVSKEPILGSAVFNYLMTKTAVSDFDGRVEIKNFRDFEKIYFNHLSYHKNSFRKS